MIALQFFPPKEKKSGLHTAKEKKKDLYQQKSSYMGQY